MRKTTANPTRLLHRAERHVQRLEWELIYLETILSTLEAAINQGAVSGLEDEQLVGRLRRVEYELDTELSAQPGAIHAHTLELVKRLNAICSPGVLSPPQEPPGDQPIPSL